jgi:hypothetical protein
MVRGLCRRSAARRDGPEVNVTSDIYSRAGYGCSVALGGLLMGAVYSLGDTLSSLVRRGNTHWA